MSIENINDSHDIISNIKSITDAIAKQEKIELLNKINIVDEKINNDDINNNTEIFFKFSNSEIYGIKCKQTDLISDHFLLLFDMWKTKHKINNDSTHISNFIFVYNGLIMNNKFYVINIIDNPIIRCVYNNINTTKINTKQQKSLLKSEITDGYNEVTTQLAAMNLIYNDNHIYKLLKKYNYKTSMMQIINHVIDNTN